MNGFTKKTCTGQKGHTMKNRDMTWKTLATLIAISVSCSLLILIALLVFLYHQGGLAFMVNVVLVGTCVIGLFIVLAKWIERR